MAGDAAGEMPMLFIFFAMFVGSVLYTLVKRFDFPLPYTVLLLLMGMVFGFIGDENLGELGVAIQSVATMDPHVMLAIFLPPLIFESAFSADYHIIMRELGQSMTLAVPGVCISTIFTGLIMHFVFPWGWTIAESLLFGAAVTATDPVAVVALLRQYGVSPRLATLIEGESLLNDGSAYVLFVIFKDFASGHPHNAKEIIVAFLRLSCGAIAVGLVVGYVCVYWLKSVSSLSLLETMITLMGAYLSFFLCESGSTGFHFSGIVAVVVCAFTISKNRNVISPLSEEFMDSFWQMITFISNTVLFLLSGVIVASRLGSGMFGFGDLGYALLLYVLLIGVRALTILILYPFLKRIGYGFDFAGAAVLTWGALRGAVGLALALMIELEDDIDKDVRNRFIFLMGIVVLLTLVVNGTTMGWVLTKVGLNRVAQESNLIYKRALNHITDETAGETLHLQGSILFSDADWDTVATSLPVYIKEPGLSEHGGVHVRPRSTAPSEKGKLKMRLPLNNELGEKHNPPSNILIDSNGLTSDSKSDFDLENDAHATKPFPADTEQINVYGSYQQVIQRNLGGVKLTEAQHQHKVMYELAQRIVGAMRSSFEAQYAQGNTSRVALGILYEACAAAGDVTFDESCNKGVIDTLWENVEVQLCFSHDRPKSMVLKCFPKLKKLYMSLDYNSIELSCELLRSYLTALEHTGNTLAPMRDWLDLDSFRMILCKLSKQRVVVHKEFLTLSVTYPEIMKHVQTLRATKTVLHFEKHLIAELFENGLLTTKEQKKMLAKVKQADSSFHINRKHRVIEDVKEHALKILPFRVALQRSDNALWESLSRVPLLHMLSDARFYSCRVTGTHIIAHGVFYVVRGLALMSNAEQISCTDEKFLRAKTGYAKGRQRSDVMLSTGAFVGVSSFMTGTPFRYNVDCRTPCGVIFIDDALMAKLCKIRIIREEFIKIAAAELLLYSFLDAFLCHYPVRSSLDSILHVCRQATFAKVDAKASGRKYMVQWPVLLVNGSATVVHTKKRVDAPYYFYEHVQVTFHKGAEMLVFPNPSSGTAQQPGVKTARPGVANSLANSLPLMTRMASVGRPNMKRRKSIDLTDHHQQMNSTLGSAGLMLMSHDNDNKEGSSSSQEVIAPEHLLISPMSPRNGKTDDGKDTQVSLCFASPASPKTVKPSCSSPSLEAFVSGDNSSPVLKIHGINSAP